MMAGFGRMENGCAKPVVIVSASSPAFAETSLHETSLQGGMSRMRPVVKLRLAAHESAVFAPGGVHLMLMQPTASVTPGARIDIAFKLDDGRTIVGKFAVRAPGA